MTWMQQNSKRADGALPLVTEAAAEQVLQVLRGRDIPADVAVRLTFVGGSLAFEVSRVQPDDMLFAYHDRMVLLMDARTALSLAGHTFDSRETPHGPQFVLRSPWEPDVT